jgi:ribose transport system substrate-binding protein
MKPKIALLLLTLTVLAAGCGPHRVATRARPATPPKIRVFAVIPRRPVDAADALVRGGALAAAKEAGNARIQWMAPKDAGAASQVHVLESAITAHVDGIAIDCADADALKPAIEKAVEADIPVVCWDGDAPASKRAAFYGVNDRAAGQKLGELLKAALPQGGDIAVLTGNMSDANSNSRIEGFKAAIENSKLRLTTVYPSDDDPAKSAAIIRQYDVEHPNIVGWCLVVGRPLLTALPGPFAGRKPGELKVVAFGSLPPELKYVSAGYVTALVGQKYYEWGHTSVKMLDQLDHGKKVPPYTESGIDVVTFGNVTAYARSAGTR